MVTRRVELPSRAASAGEARRFVRQQLLDAGLHRWQEAAELAVSELVTNAFLHAHTQVQLTVTTSAVDVLVEVQDGAAALPEQRYYGEQATTGRGMSLVAAVTSGHGVRPELDGKVVWFRLSDDTPVSDPEDARLDAWAFPEDVPAPSDAEAVQVTLLGLPPTLWRAAREHHETLLRELALVRADSRDHAHDADPDSRDSDSELARVDAARNVIWAALERTVAATGPDRARPGHPAAFGVAPPTVDLVLRLSPASSSDFTLFQELLEQGEELAQSGRLLAHPALPEIVAVRDWVCEQIISQLAGAAASVWVGADAERFASELTSDPHELVWDPALVVDAEVGAVAADDRNRILAVSRPFTDALGWTAEQLVGRRVVVIIPPRFREAHVAGFTRHLATGQAHVLGVDLTLPVLRADGGETVCNIKLEAHPKPNGRAVYVAWISPLSRPCVDGLDSTVRSAG